MTPIHSPLVAATFTPRDRTWGVLAIIASALMFAMSGIVAKVALTAGGMEPMRLVSLRVLFAAVIQLVLLFFFSRAEFRQSPRDLVKLAGLGVVGIAMMQFSYFNHLQRLPVSIGMLIQYLAPLFVVLAARFIFGEQVRRRMWGALALSLGGLALVSQVKAGSSLDPVGVMWAFAAALALTVYYLLGERAVANSSPLATQTWMLVFAALAWMVVKPFWTFDFTVMSQQVPLPGPFAGHSVALWWLFGYIVVFGTVTTYILVMWGVKRIGAPAAGLLGMLEPVAITFLGWLILQEHLTALQWVGAGTTITGVILAATARQRKRKSLPAGQQLEPEPLPDPGIPSAVSAPSPAEVDDASAPEGGDGEPGDGGGPGSGTGHDGEGPDAGPASEPPRA